MLLVTDFSYYLKFSAFSLPLSNSAKAMCRRVAVGPFIAGKMSLLLLFSTLVRSCDFGF